MTTDSADRLNYQAMSSIRTQSQLKYHIYIIQGDIFFKSVFNGLLQTKSMK